METSEGVHDKGDRHRFGISFCPNGDRHLFFTDIGFPLTGDRHLIRGPFELRVRSDNAGWLSHPTRFPTMRAMAVIGFRFRMKNQDRARCWLFQMF